jgi:phage tail-like protein
MASKTNFSKQFPAHYTEEDQTGAWQKFLSAIEQELDGVVALVDDFSDLWDILNTDEGNLPYLSQQKGWTLEVTSPATLKRKIVSLLLPLYHKKGTAPGVVDVLRLLLGIEVLIREPWSSAWKLGTDAIGSSAILGAGLPSVPRTNPKLYTFYVVFPSALTSAERAAATALIDFMKRAETHFKMFEPYAGRAPFVLGCSRLGEDELRVHQPYVVPEGGYWDDDHYVSYLGGGVTLSVSSAASLRRGALRQGARYLVSCDVDVYLRQGNRTVVATSGDFLLRAGVEWPMTPGNPRSRFLAALGVASGTLRIVRADSDRMCSPPKRPPKIISVTPNTGIAGGTVTIDGDNFTAASSVKLSGVSASFSVVSATRITATIPGTVIPGSWSVTTDVATAYFSWPY